MYWKEADMSAIQQMLDGSGVVHDIKLLVCVALGMSVREVMHARGMARAHQLKDHLSRYTFVAEIELKHWWWGRYTFKVLGRMVLEDEVFSLRYSPLFWRLKYRAKDVADRRRLGLGYRLKPPDSEIENFLRDVAQVIRRREAEQEQQMRMAAAKPA
jgi:hypothetical protein